MTNAIRGIAGARRSRYTVLAFVAMQVAAAVAGAQTASTTPTWQQLQGFEFENESDITGGASVTTTLSNGAPVTSGPGAQLVARYFSHASALAAFISANPGDSRLSEARRLEVLMLIEAESYGNFTQEAQCASMLTEVLNDTNLSEAVRSSLAVFASATSLSYQGYTSATGAGLAQIEVSLRSIVAKFPHSPAGYVALLSFAKYAPEAQMAKIVKDLAGISAPAAVVADAQLMLNRYNLEGKQIGPILSANLSAGRLPGLEAGHVTIIYGWTIMNPGSAFVAAQIKSLAPAGANVIGVNLDSSASAASAVATAGGYPGTQLYDPAGAGSTLAKALYLDLDDVVILANHAGTIVSVTGAHGMAAKLAAADQ